VNVIASFAIGFPSASVNRAVAPYTSNTSKHASTHGPKPPMARSPPVAVTTVRWRPALVVVVVASVVVVVVVVVDVSAVVDVDVDEVDVSTVVVVDGLWEPFTLAVLTRPAELEAPATGMAHNATHPATTTIDASEPNARKRAWCTAELDARTFRPPQPNTTGLPGSRRPCYVDTDPRIDVTIVTTQLFAD
jgi:hypothetical protein